MRECEGRSEGGERGEWRERKRVIAGEDERGHIIYMHACILKHTYTHAHKRERACIHTHTHTILIEGPSPQQRFESLVRWGKKVFLLLC